MNKKTEVSKGLRSLLSNIEKRNREYELQISGEYLTTIQDAYFTYFRMQTDLPILIIDLKDKDFIKDSKIYDFIKGCMRQHYPPGINRVSIL